MLEFAAASPLARLSTPAGGRAAHRLQRDPPWPREGAQKQSFAAQERALHRAGPRRAVVHRRIEPHQRRGIRPQDFPRSQCEPGEIPRRVDEYRPRSGQTLQHERVAGQHASPQPRDHRHR